MTRPESAQIRTLQIVVVALLTGAITFLGIAAFLVTTGESGADSGPLVPILFVAWLAVGSGGLVVWPLVRRRQAASAVAALADGTERGRVLAAQCYASSTIVGAALAEGTTLLAAVGGLVTGSPGLLAAGLLGLVAIVVLYPSQQKFERFVERGGAQLPPISPG